ncbi:MAG: PIN domain-containing protein [Methylococcaceae bacterium]|nr:PIN domain-containing protein [Methylococcaceae bacterium]
MYILDTNICSYILKKHSPLILEKFQQVDDIHISSIVYAELCYGIALSPEHLKAPRRKQLQQFMDLLTLHSWDAKAAESYAVIRADLKIKGTPIGNMDTLIAAHAVSLKAILVTNNVREFERVVGLQFESWA